MRDRLQSTQCARFLKALADPERLRIVQCLQHGPKHVGEVAEVLGAGLANTSHHLHVLRRAGLVCDERQGKYVRYSLSPRVYKPGAGRLDLGCCQLDLGGRG